MGRRDTILFLQHAGMLGGSCVSLRELVTAMDRERFRPVVALLRPSPELERYHSEGGVEVIAWPGIRTFEHTSADWGSLKRPSSWTSLAGGIAAWPRSERRTLELVARVRPDVVHLNSAVLVPSARALRNARVPFVWHVREVPAPGHFGLRTGAMRRAIAGWPDAALFLTPLEERLWIGPGRGRIAPEPVDLRRFTPRPGTAEARARLGIAAEAPVALYVGGMSEIKGIVPLLEAIAIARDQMPDLTCLMPGAVPASGLLVDLAAAVAPSLTLTGRIRSLLSRPEIADACRLLPFTADITELMAASDVLVFPSTADHFARPIVEAGAMRKPVVASRFPTIEEQVVDGISGILVPPGDPAALSHAMVETLQAPARAAAMGEAGRRIALERFEARRAAAAVTAVYDALLAARG